MVWRHALYMATDIIPSHTLTRPQSAHLRSRLRLRPQCGASKRQRKDPRQFQDMDELRAALHAQESGAPGFIAGGLNLVSRDAFGSETCDMMHVVSVDARLRCMTSAHSTIAGCSCRRKHKLASCSVKGGEQGGIIGRLYRRILEGKWARSLRSGLQCRPGYWQTPAEAAAAAPAASSAPKQPSPPPVRTCAFMTGAATAFVSVYGS